MKIKSSREEDKDNLEIQAKLIKNINVSDKNKGDPRSILACVIKRTDEEYVQL